MTAIYAPASKLDTLIYLLEFVPPSLDILGQLKKLLPSLAILDNAHYAEHYEKIQQISQRLEEEITDSQIADTLTVGFGGGFSAGKSRFINSLLGIEVLPEALEPCTAVATYLSQGDSEHFMAQNVFHRKLPVNAEQISTLKHFVGADDNQNLQISEIVRQIHFTTPKMLWKNLTFLDTPGYSKADNSEHNNSDEQIALTQLKNVDYIVWLVSAKNGMMREDDFAFLEEVQPKNPIFIVLTQADLANSLADVKQVMKAVTSHLNKKGIDYAGIMAWSAPLNQKTGSKVSGDDIQKWLKTINKPQHNVGFQLLEDYIQELKQLANNFTSIPSLDKQTKDLYKKIHLQPMDNKPSSDKVTQTFKFLVENLTTQIYVNIAEYYTQTNDLLSASDYYFKTTYLPESMTWLEQTANYHDEIAHRLAQYYLNTSTPYKVISDIYIRLAKNGYPTAIDNLLSLVKKTSDKAVLREIAYFFEHYQQDLNTATDIHIKIFNNGKDTTSTDWLLQQAVSHPYALQALDKLVNKAKLKTLYFDYAKVLLILEDKQKALEFITKSAQMDDDKAIDWLFSHAPDENQVYAILQKLIDDKGQADLYYRYALFLENQQQKGEYIKYLLKAVELEKLQAIGRIVDLSIQYDRIYAVFRNLTENSSSGILYYHFALLEESKQKSKETIYYLLKSFAFKNQSAEERLEHYAKRSHIVSYAFAESYEKNPHRPKKAVEYFIQSAQLAINPPNNKIFQPAFDKLFSYALEQHYALATDGLIELYHTYLDDFDKLSQLHIENAKTHGNAESLLWLFNHAKHHSTIRIALRQIVNLNKSEKSTYQYLDIVYRFDDSNEAIEKVFEFAKNNDSLALAWLEEKANRDSRVALVLGDLHLRVVTMQHIPKATSYYVKSAQQGNEKAVDGMLEIMSFYNRDASTQEFIQAYHRCMPHIQKRLITLYETSLNLNLIRDENQRNIIYQLFYDEIKRGDKNLLAQFAQLLNNRDSEYGKLLLADMYIKDDIEKDHYAKAYKTYADIQFSSKEAKYNMQVLKYHGLGTEKQRFDYFTALITNKNQKFFNTGFNYLWSQLLGYRKPALVEPFSQQAHFTTHPFKAVLNGLIIIAVILGLGILTHTYNQWRKAEIAREQQIQMERGHEEARNATPQSVVAEPAVTPTLQPMVFSLSSLEGIFSCQAIVGDEQIASAVRNLLDTVFDPTMACDISMNSEREIDYSYLDSMTNILKYLKMQQVDYEINYRDIRIIGVNQSSLDNLVAQLSNDYPDFSFTSQIFQPETQFESESTDEYSESSPEQVTESNESQSDLEHARKNLEKKKAEFTALWKTGSATAQQALTPSQISWVEQRNKDCENEAQQVGSDRQEITQIECTITKLEERAKYIQDYFEKHPDTGISEEEKQAKETLNKTKVKFNTLWKTLPIDKQARLTEDQTQWVANRDKKCEAKAREAAIENQNLVKFKCLNLLTEHRLEALEQYIKTKP